MSIEYWVLSSEHLYWAISIEYWVVSIYVELWVLSIEYKVLDIKYWVFSENCNNSTVSEYFTSRISLLKNIGTKNCGVKEKTEKEKSVGY